MPPSARFAPILLAVLAVSPGRAAAQEPPAVPAYPVVIPRPGPAVAAMWVPPTAAHLHIYILDGVNPLGVAGLESLAERFRRVGFPRVRIGGWYHGPAFEKMIKAAYAEDPTARFAVIGYSAGTYAARDLANRLVKAGVPVDVVGYIGGDYLADTEFTRVPGAGRVVNIRGDGYLLTGRNLFFNGTEITGAVNVRYPGTWHYGLPGAPGTFATLYAALADGG